MNNKTKNDDKIYAAIDLGTNACRLKIVSVRNGKGIKILETFSKVIQFGESIRTAGRLSDEAIHRGVETLKECSIRLSKYKLQKYMFVATEACRSASNAQEFIDEVYDKSGIKLQTISWKDEAYFSTLACVNLINIYYKYGIVFDIGGGSTEFSWFKYANGKTTIIDSISIPIGFITLADPNDENAKRKKCAMMRDLLYKFYIRNNIAYKIAIDNVQIIGVSGTLNSIISFVLNTSRYNRQLVNGFVLRKYDIENALRKILNNNVNSIIIKNNSPSEGVEEVENVNKSKSFIIKDSAKILYEIYSMFKLPIIISDSGVRDGIIRHMIEMDNSAR